MKIWLHITICVLKPRRAIQFNYFEDNVEITFSFRCNEINFANCSHIIESPCNVTKENNLCMFLMSINVICCYSKRNWFRVNWRIYLGFAKDLLQIGFTWFIIEYMCLYAMNLYMTCKELFYWPSSVKTESKLCCLYTRCVNQTTRYEE